MTLRFGRGGAAIFETEADVATLEEVIARARRTVREAQEAFDAWARDPLREDAWGFPWSWRHAAARAEGFLAVDDHPPAERASPVGLADAS